ARPRTGRMPVLIQALDAAIFGPRTDKHPRAHMRYRVRYRGSIGALMKKVVNFTRCFRAHAGNLGEVGLGSALDCLQRAKVLQERALAGRANARDFLQAGLAQVLLAAGAMRTDRKAMRLVA